MEIGDLVQMHNYPRYWGIILAIADNQYEVFWMDGDRTWMAMEVMVKKERC